jgi:hypothetical protein
MYSFAAPAVTHPCPPSSAPTEFELFVSEAPTKALLHSQMSKSFPVSVAQSWTSWRRTDIVLYVSRGICAVCVDSIDHVLNQNEGLYTLVSLVLGNRGAQLKPRQPEKTEDEDHDRHQHFEKDVAAAD